MENEETYIQKRRIDKDLEEILNLLCLALFLCGLIIIFCVSLASAYHPGESYIIDLSSKFDTVLNYSIEGNLSEIELNLTNNKMQVHIPTSAEISNYTLSFYGYKADAPVEILYSSGGSSYLPKKSIVIYPNSTNNSQSAIHSAIDNETNPESTKNVLNNTQESQSLFGRFWDWLVNLFRRLFG